MGYMFDSYNSLLSICMPTLPRPTLFIVFNGGDSIPHTLPAYIQRQCNTGHG